MRMTSVRSRLTYGNGWKAAPAHRVPRLQRSCDGEELGESPAAPWDRATGEVQ